MTRLLHLLLVIGALCGPATASSKIVFDDLRKIDADPRQQATDLLTENLFVVNQMLMDMEAHVRQLDSWESSVSKLESRLTAMEAGQERSADQLSAALQRLENGTEGTAAVRAELLQVATSEASTAAAVDSLRTDVAESLSGVGELVTYFVNHHATQHEQTRGACRESGAQLSQLTELRTAVSQATELAQRTEEALSGGLERVDGRLQETTQKLEKLGQELREDRQALLATSTPVPTVDPNRLFLDALQRSLRERQVKRRQESATVPTTQAGERTL